MQVLWGRALVNLSSVCVWVGDRVQALWVCVLGRVEVWLNCVLVSVLYLWARVFFGPVLRVLVLSACASSVWALLVRVSIGWAVGGIHLHRTGRHACVHLYTAAAKG